MNNIISTPTTKRICIKIDTLQKEIDKKTDALVKKVDNLQKEISDKTAALDKKLDVLIKHLIPPAKEEQKEEAGSEYWRRRLIPSLKRITEWAGEYCHSSYIAVRVVDFTFDNEKILTRINCRNIYRQCHLKEVEKEARPKDLPRGLEVDEYQYSICSIPQWDRMFRMGGFIQAEEMGNTYGVRRNDAPAWVKKGPRPRCVCPLFDGYLVHHRLIFDIEKLGGLIVPEDPERSWLSPGFNIYNLNGATYSKFSEQPWNESAHQPYFDDLDRAEQPWGENVHRPYFEDLDHTEWACDF